jgi:transglutaminase-like putative cysteine protease
MDMGPFKTALIAFGWFGLFLLPCSGGGAHQSLSSEGGSLSVEIDIPNRSTLSFLCLRAVIECPAVKQPSDLNTRAQTFEGKVVRGRIEGIFTIRSTLIEQGETVDMAATPKERSDLAIYLKPDSEIESTVDPFQDAAAKITRGLKKRWHAVHALGTWMRKTIALHPDGAEGATQVLRECKGNALGIARLHVAFCRSVGIPARVVTGGVYFNRGGERGFQEHFWSEVHMGGSGWKPVDVVSGQVNYLDAGHLRLGEKGPFLPRELEILDYIPKPEDQRKPVAVQTADFPLPRGETHVYGYHLTDQRVGGEKITFLGEETVDGKAIFVFTSEVDLKGKKSKTLTKAGRDGRLYYYESETDNTHRIFRVEGEDVVCEIRTNDSSKEERIRLPPEGLFFDSQQIYHLAFLLTRLRLDPGQVIQVGVFHPSSLRVLSLQVEYAGHKEVELEGESQKVRVYDLRLGFQRMVVCLTQKGILVEETEQGGLVQVRWNGSE